MNELTERIIGAAIEVHKVLGPASNRLMKDVWRMSFPLPTSPSNAKCHCR
jgi:hypothetical protein